MRYELEQLNDRVECCFVYVDSLDDDLKKNIKENLVEIIRGKNEAERIKDEPDSDTVREAAKYIYEKKTPGHRIAIIGEFLFHCVLRSNDLKEKFLSTSPTIGFSDSYSQFYKGFDGCYYGDDSIWIAEVKSKSEKSNDIDKDNKSKIKEASNQIKIDTADLNINRWSKAKSQVHTQLTKEEQKEINIFQLLNIENIKKYNQIPVSFLINDSDNFNKEYVLKYFNTLFHSDVENQKMFIVCIRSIDVEQIVDYIKNDL